MKAIATFFRNPLLISILGLAALALIIWFVGPLIAIAGYEPLVEPTPRLLLILFVVIVWGIGQARRRLKEQQANAQIVEGLAGGAAGAAPDKAPTQSNAGEAEVALLQKRFTEALDFLKKPAKGAQRIGLYALPWYVIIGPPGAGKTTALLNSGLNFPLANRFGSKPLKGVGGTRNCDWWFTDDAILIDTAGRYVTQDSDQDADRAAWQGFLALLKKTRPRRPLNGVLVAVDVLDLLQLSPEERDAHIQSIRKRVGEIYAYFGMSFPVYVLLTKADLIAGFTEFFEDLDKNDRAHVWGFTFPLEENGAAPTDLGNQIRTEYDLLLRRVNDRLVWRLENERDPQRRALIFGFPGQIVLLREVMEEFITGCFEPNAFETPILLRGVYFTSGTQEGTPIDRLLGSVARGFGLTSQAVSPSRGPGRSYFITDLLRHVVFHESNIVGTNRRLERLRALSQRGGYAAAAAAVLVAGLLWLVSYRNNHTLIDNVSRQVAGVEKELPTLTSTNLDLAATLPILGAARTIPGGFQDRDLGRPLMATFGLYQGRRLGTAAEDLYARLLRDAFLPRLVLRVESQIRNAPNDPDFLLEALRVYRLLGEASHVDPEAIRAWMHLDWEAQAARLAAVDRQQLADHLEAFLDLTPQPAEIPLDGALIRQVQRTLRAAPLADRAYARLKRRSAEGVKPFTIAAAAGRDAMLVFARRSGAPLTDGIPGLFTRAGHERIFRAGSRELSQQLVGEDWVLTEDTGTTTPQPPADAAELEAAILKLYLSDYGKQYEELLGDLTIVPTPAMDRSIAVLQILSGPQSPLLALLQAVAQETALGSATGTAAQGIPAADGVVDAAKNRLREMLGNAADRAAAQVAGNPGSAVADALKARFGELQDAVNAPAGGKSPFQAVLDILNQLYVLLDSMQKNPDGAKALMDGARQVDSLVASLGREAERQPKVVKGVLADAGAAAKGSTGSTVRKSLNSLWQSSGSKFCQQAIANRYPVGGSSATELSLQDLGTFFGPGGIVDSFVTTSLAEYVDTSRDPWRWRPGSDMSNASTDALAQLQIARKVMDTFFPGGSKTPSVAFDLTPISMDESITRFLLDVEGQPVAYEHGPLVRSSLVWPGPGARQVRIDMTPPSGSGPSGATESGTWAWFRLLDRASKKPGGARDQFAITFAVGGRSARFHLAAKSAYHPFGSNPLRAFHCPNAL